METRVVNHTFPDGITRGILEYRNHWWNKWRPYHRDGKLACVTYLGDGPWKESAQDECFDNLGLDSEQRKCRENMIRYIYDAEEIYVGARIGSEYHIGYDVDSDESMETLRNLEEDK